MAVQKVSVQIPFKFPLSFFLALLVLNVLSSDLIAQEGIKFFRIGTSYFAADGPRVVWRTPGFEPELSSVPFRLANPEVARISSKVLIPTAKECLDSPIDVYRSPEERVDGFSRKFTPFNAWFSPGEKYLFHEGTKSQQSGRILEFWTVELPTGKQLDSIFLEANNLNRVGVATSENVFMLCRVGGSSILNILKRQSSGLQPFAKISFPQSGQIGDTWDTIATSEDGKKLALTMAGYWRERDRWKNAFISIRGAQDGKELTRLTNVNLQELDANDDRLNGQTLFSYTREPASGRAGYSSKPQGITSIQFSPDGRLVAVCSGVASIWDANTGELKSFWVPAKDELFQFSRFVRPETIDVVVDVPKGEPTLKTFAIGRKQALNSLNENTPSLDTLFGKRKPWQHYDITNGLFPITNTNCFVTKTPNNGFSIKDRHGTLIAEEPAKSGYSGRIKVSPSGRYVWRCYSSRIRRAGRPDSIYHSELYDLKAFISSDLHRKIKQSEEMIKAISIHPLQLRDLIYQDTQPAMSSIKRLGEKVFFFPEKVIVEIEPKRSLKNPILLNQRQNCWVELIGNGSIRVNDFRTGKVTEHQLHQSAISQAVVSEHGKQLATVSYDGTCCIWDFSTQQIEKQIDCDDVPKTAIAISRSGDIVAVGDKNGVAKLIVVETGEVKTVTTIRSSKITAACFSPNSMYFATGSSNGSIQIWSSKTGALINSFDNSTREVLHLRFDSKGESLAVARKGDVVDEFSNLKLMEPELQSEVDWSLESKDQSALPPFAIAKLKSTNFYAGDVATLEVEIENKGKSDLVQTWATFNPTDKNLKPLNWFFGRIAAGEKISKKQEIPIPETHSGGPIEGEIKFMEANGYGPPKQKIVAAVQQFPRPDFPVSWNIFDDGSGSSVGNGDGKIQFQESIDFEFELENKIGREIDGCQISISERNAKNAASPIRAFGKPVMIPRIDKGQKRKCRINVITRPSSERESATFIFRITDNRGRVLFRKEVKFDIAKRN